MVLFFTIKEWAPSSKLNLIYAKRVLIISNGCVTWTSRFKENILLYSIIRTCLVLKIHEKTKAFLTSWPWSGSAWEIASTCGTTRSFANTTTRRGWCFLRSPRATTGTRSRLPATPPRDPPDSNPTRSVELLLGLFSFLPFAPLRDYRPVISLSFICFSNRTRSNVSMSRWLLKYKYERSSEKCKNLHIRANLRNRQEINKSWLTCQKFSINEFSFVHKTSLVKGVDFLSRGIWKVLEFFRLWLFIPKAHTIFWGEMACCDWE